jgi:hypothetical protein
MEIQAHFAEKSPCNQTLKMSRLVRSLPLKIQ